MANVSDCVCNGVCNFFFIRKIIPNFSIFIGYRLGLFCCLAPARNCKFLMNSEVGRETLPPPKVCLSQCRVEMCMQLTHTPTCTQTVYVCVWGD